MGSPYASSPWPLLHPYGASPIASYTPSRSQSPHQASLAARIHHDHHSLYGVPSSIAPQVGYSGGHGSHSRVSPKSEGELRPLLGAGPAAISPAYSPMGEPLASTGSASGMPPFSVPGAASTFKQNPLGNHSPTASSVGNTILRGQPSAVNPRPADVLPPSAAVLGSSSSGAPPMFIYHPGEAAKVKARIAKSTGSVGVAGRSASFPYSGTPDPHSPHPAMYRPSPGQPQQHQSQQISRLVHATGVVARQRSSSPDPSPAADGQQNHPPLHATRQDQQLDPQGHPHGTGAPRPLPVASGHVGPAALEVHRLPSEHEQQRDQLHHVELSNQAAHHYPSEQDHQPSTRRLSVSSPFELKMGAPGGNMHGIGTAQVNPPDQDPHPHAYLAAQSQRVLSHSIQPDSTASAPAPGNTIAARSFYQTHTLSGTRPLPSTADPMSISAGHRSGRCWPSREEGFAEGEESSPVVGGVLSSATGPPYHSHALTPFGAQAGHHSGHFEGTPHPPGQHYFIPEAIPAEDLGRRESVERFADHEELQHRHHHPGHPQKHLGHHSGQQTARPQHETQPHEYGAHPRNILDAAHIRSHGSATMPVQNAGSNEVPNVANLHHPSRPLTGHHPATR